MSDDGSMIGMSTTFSDELPGDRYGIAHAYVSRRGSGVLRRIMNRDGDEILAHPGGNSDMSLQLSGDGRYALTVTAAINPMGDDDRYPDQNAFLVDTTSARVVARVTTDMEGDATQPFDTAINGDGRYVAFVAEAPGDLGTYGIYRWDRQTGRSTLLPDTTVDGLGSIHGVDIDPSGRFVAYGVADEDGRGSQVWLWDARTGTSRLVSTTPSGEAGGGSSYQPSVSDGGRFVAFMSSANDLVAGDRSSEVDVLVWDAARGASTRLSLAPDGSDLDRGAVGPVISADGRSVAFTSAATNIADAPDDGTDDVDGYVVRRLD